MVSVCGLITFNLKPVENPRLKVKKCTSPIYFCGLTINMPVYLSCKKEITLLKLKMEPIKSSLRFLASINLLHIV